MTLITDRTQADVDAAKNLRKKRLSEMTEEERASWLNGMKGAYNAMDLNRVQEAMEEIAEMLTGYGYPTAVKRPSITGIISGGNKLPAGYIELDYIQSNGAEYIDTLFKANQDTRVVADFEFTGSTSLNTLLGAWHKSNEAMYIFQGAANGATAYCYYGTKQVNVTTTISGRHTVDINKNVFNVDGTAITDAGYQSFSCNYNLVLLAYNNAGSINGITAAKIYSIKIYDNGTLVRDFVPCMVKATKEVGLYDLVDGKFYGNAGTGYFIPGPVATLPEGYTKLICIKSSGAQYIDTLFYPKYSSRVVADIANLSDVAGFVFGARTGTSSGQFTAYRQASSKFRSDYFGTQESGTVGDTTGRGIVDKNRNVLTMYGVAVTNTAVSSGESSCSLLLFALNSNNSPGNYASYNMYCCVIYDNDVLVRLFTPCMAPDGSIGLYDSITEVFFGNAGTGAFVAGDAIETPSQPSTGTRDYWEMSDIADPANRALYLENVQTIRDALAELETTPQVPPDMENFTWQQANEIEQILLDVSYLIEQMALAFMHSGEMYCGEV